MHSCGKDAVYGFIERMLRVQQYCQLSKGKKGVVRRFLSKITEISRAQLSRLTHRWMEHRKIERRPARRPDFPRRYTAMDIAQLDEVDAAAEDLSGPAVKHLFKREFHRHTSQANDRHRVAF